MFKSPSFKVVPFLLLLLFFPSCATQNNKNTSKDKSQVIESGYSVGNTFSTEGVANEDHTQMDIQQTKKAKFGVWIDGAGFDSLMALGVLQELEKAGLKPSKIVGTGFGCWVAMSWALNNSKNQAEWQSFKWKNWELLQKGNLLSRIGGSNAFEKTETEINKHFQKITFKDFVLPIDCPMIPKNPPFKFQSGRFVNVDRALATQLFMPFVEMESNMDSEMTWYSGAFGGVPTSQELLDFSKEVISKLSEDEMWVGWIVLKTRNFSDFGSYFKPLSEIQSYRSDEKSLDSSRLAARVFDLRKESRAFIPTKSVLSLDDRRVWLLEGRRQGPFVVERIKNDEFLKTDLR